MLRAAKRQLLKKIAVKVFLTISWVCFCVAPLLAELLPVKTYTVADGLLRDNVFKIRSDSRGFLWFCTVEGISRFDGYAFTNFTVDDGLPSRYVNDFLETRDGTIWIATNGGLARLNPHGARGSRENLTAQNAGDTLFTTLLPDNQRAKTANVLFEDENGSVFVGTDDGLYRLNEQQGKLQSIDLGRPPPTVDAQVDNLAVTAIIKDRRGALWIGTATSGLLRLLPNGAVETFGTADGLAELKISALLEDHDGRIWVGMKSGVGLGGLSRLVVEPEKNSNIVERHFTTKDNLPADWVTSLSQTGDGQMWVATIRGLCRWRGAENGENSVCQNYTAANDFCDQDVWSLAEDKDRNLWVGTRCGLKKLKRYGVTTYTAADGINGQNANSIFENAAGELFVSFTSDTQSRTISRFDGERFESVAPSFPPEVTYSGWGNRQTVWQTSAGDWFFPTGHGLFQFKKTARFADLARTTPQKIEFGSQESEIFRFFEDSSGNFWIATTGNVSELWFWERAVNRWQNLSQELNLGKRRLGLSFVEDRARNLWISTGGDNEDDAALIRRRNGRFEIFTKAENKLLTGWMHSLFVDSKNRLWITNSAYGLLRLDDVAAANLTFEVYSPADGLSSFGIMCVTEDQFGRIYIGTGRGLDRLIPETGQIENFTVADGLPNSYVETSFRDRKNHLWFGTPFGLAKFVPEPPSARKPPNILITGLRVEGESQKISVLGESHIAPIELASDQRQVAIDFVGLGTDLGERLKYEYRVGNADWTPTSERTINLTNLAAGDYRVEIRAQSADRIYSQTAGAMFRIAAPFWQRPWFAALVLLATALIIYLFYKYRLIRLLEMERMRTRIATDLHDDIGANLTRISLLSEVAKQNFENQHLLTSIAEISRESVASMNDIVWAISPNHDSFLDLTRRMRQHAEEIFALREIDLKFTASVSDLKLSVGVRRDVLLIFKEAVNNVAKHSNCAAVTIDLSCENLILHLKIADDGIGFDSGAESDGQGLRSLKRRAAALGGKLEIISSADNGTAIDFALKLPKIGRV